METKIINIGNQKGGVGKSTITSLIANYLHLKTDYSVCVIDADDLQGTLSHFRNKDLENGHKEENLYDLIKINSKDFPKTYMNAIMGEYDFVFVDLPGNLKQQGVIQAYAMADYIFIPTSLTPADLDSTLKFVDYYDKDILPVRSKAGFSKPVIKAFLNKINPRTLEYKQFDLNREVYTNPEFLEGFIPYSEVTFGRNANTAEIYSGNGNKDFNRFCEELISVITKN
ncbi:MAG: ParA family protein [Bacteroidia bacterium]